MKNFLLRALSFALAIAATSSATGQNELIGIKDHEEAKKQAEENSSKDNTSDNSSKDASEAKTSKDASENSSKDASETKTSENEKNNEK